MVQAPLPDDLPLRPKNPVTRHFVGISEELPEGSRTIGAVLLAGNVEGRGVGVQEASPEPLVFPAQTASALSLATTIGSLFPGRVARLLRIAVTYDTAPTTSENLTLTMSPANPARPSVVMFSNDPSATSATSVVNTWEGGYKLQAGDELTLAYTNTDTRTIKAEIVLELV